MPKFGIERTDIPDNPNRCQANVKNSQCQNLAYRAPDGTFPTTHCVMHGGQQAALRKFNDDNRTYKIEKYKDRIVDLVNNPKVKSLREEIALLRILVEERFNAIKPDDPFSMIAASGPISEMISKIERVVRTCQDIEEKTGATLDRQQVLQLGDNVINVIFKHIEALPLAENIISDLLSNITFDLDLVFKGKEVPRPVQIVENVQPIIDGVATEQNQVSPI